MSGSLFYIATRLAGNTRILGALLVLGVIAVLNSPVAFACETRDVRIRGQIDINLPLLTGQLPGNVPVAQQISAAQLSATSSVYDSLGHPHVFYFLLFHINDSVDYWLPRVIFDGGEFVDGQKGTPYEIAFRGMTTAELNETEPHINASGFAPQWKNKASSGNVRFILEFHGVAGASDIDFVQDGGPNPCEQNATTDFDGDGKDDVAIWRPAIGFWAIKKSSTDNREIIWKQWGLPGDIPMPGDYTGDGRADLVVWRPSEGNWYICPSDNNFDCSKGTVLQFGLLGDQPIKGDFNGDHILDLAVYRPNNNCLYYRTVASGGGGANAVVQSWGLPGDIPLFGGIGR